MFGLGTRYRYNSLKNVRIDTSTMKVYRKYLRNSDIVWKQVDYKTTHQLASPRLCPKDYALRLLKTAF